jgi:Zn finger protein HypA/HybF involved in hydrogenase expression
LNPHKLRYIDLVVWCCPAGSDHIWKRNFKKSQGRVNCPYCTNKAVSVTNKLTKLFPQIAAELHPTKNGTLHARQLTANTQRPVWWLCKVCAHQWQARVGARTLRGSGCPKCWSVRRKRLSRKQEKA